MSVNPPPGFTLDPVTPPLPPSGFTLDQPATRPQLPSKPIIPGNIDPFNRPKVYNPDGTYSTLRTITIDDGGRTVLLPTVINGRLVSPQEAIQHYRQTKEHLGIFDSEAAANAYDKQLHNQIEPGSYERGAVPPPPSGFTLNPPGVDPATYQARLAAAQGVAAAPGDVLGAIGRHVAESDIGRIVGTYGPPISGAVHPALETLANLPGIAQIGQAARAVGGAVKTISSTSSGVIENTVTGGVGYDQRFQEQGADPQGAKILGSLFRGTLDPTTLLVAPGPIAKAIGTGVAIARTTGNLVRATGAVEPVAQAAGTAARLLTEGRWTGPIIQRTADLAVAGMGKVGPLVNKYYGLPPDFRQNVEQYLGEIRTMLGKSMTLQAQMLNDVPVEADRIILGQALRGLISEAQIPERLRPAYKDLFYVSREKTTQAALDSGTLLTARENYMRRYYPSEAYARIKAGAVDPLPGMPSTMPAEVPGRPATPSPEVRAAQIQETLPEEGRRGVYGRQVEPTKGFRGLSSGFQKQRVLSEEASMALGAHQDPAIALPGHDVEVGHAIANKNLYERVVNLGEDWVRPDGPGVPTNWLGMGQVVGEGNAAKYGWAGFRVHPQVAQAISDITGGKQFGFNQMLTIPNVVNNALKRVIFLTPTVHSANQIRGAYLDKGWKIFTPQYWQDVRTMMQDAREMGPISQARLAAGGSIGGGGISGQVADTINEIFLHGPAAPSLRQAGIIGRAAGSQEVAQAGNKLTKGMAFVRVLNDEVLWGYDAAGRNLTFRDALAQITKQAPNLSQEEAAQYAAKYADRVWNDYSRVHYGPIEKVLNSLIFVYPWTRGRVQLFGAMARAYLPSSAPDIALYRQLAGRWAAANLVLPHIYRAWNDKQSAGFEAARIPAATYTDAQGRERQIYIKPTGWYNDAAEMIQDPTAFALARMNPGLRSAADLYEVAKDAKRQGRNATADIIRAMVPGTPGSILANLYPAGVPQALQPVPWPYRIAPALGVSVTGPPPSENPRMQMQQKLDQGDFFGAGVLAKQSGMSFYQTIANVPAAGRKQFRQGYDRGGGIPGMPKLPTLPKTP